MPSYGSLHSPSLRKMENSRGSYGRKGINMGNIIGDPFALATVSIAGVSKPFQSFLARRPGGRDIPASASKAPLFYLLLAGLWMADSPYV